MLLQVNRHINNKLEWYELALLKKNEEERMVGFCFINLGFSFLVYICIYIYHIIIFKKNIQIIKFDF